MEVTHKAESGENLVGFSFQFAENPQIFLARAFGARSRCLGSSSAARSAKKAFERKKVFF